MRVGFIGLGTMGAGMAHNVHVAGHQLLVHDLDASKAQAVVAEGATWCESVESLVEQVDVVFTSVPGPTDMRRLAEQAGGILETLRSGGVWFDLTTNSPTVVREIHVKARERGIELLDAPVSGGPKGAWSGALAIYVGGDPAIFAEYEYLLGAIGDQVMYVGAIGAGNAAKLVHNTASLTTRMVIAEAFSLGVKAGVEPAALWHALRQGAIGRSRTFDRIGDQYLQNKYDPPNFALTLADKDFRLALQLADELDVPMRGSETIHGYYAEALERGWGHRDSRVPMSLQNEVAGVEIALTAEEVKAVTDRG